MLLRLRGNPRCVGKKSAGREEGEAQAIVNRTRRLGLSPARKAFFMGMLAATSLCRVTMASVDDCERLGAALTEHSCFHAKFGPFNTVEASLGVKRSASTPAVDSVHTEYRVVLADPSERNIVTYSPARSGQWVVFTASDVPLLVEDSAGEPRPLLRLDEGTTGCEALPIARTFELAADERYTFLLGPHDVREVILVVEYADDFLVAQSRDRDGDGYGDPAETTEPSACTPDEGWAAKTGDCDDADADVHPGARETCDDVDRNCNGLPDDVGLHCRLGAGACETTGVFNCVGQDGEFASCDAVEGSATEETCNGMDDDCDGLIDEEASLCTDVATPSCVRHEMGSFCGCLVDADCGGDQSGRVCDETSRICLDGCRSLPTGNGCPEGKSCAQTEQSLGVCVDDSEREREPSLRDPAEGGCSCQLRGRGGADSGSWLVLALVILAFAIRRRAVSLAAVLLLVGCGGRLEDGGPAEGKGCKLVLSAAPEEHACSHGVHGPFESVVATALDGQHTPSVDEIHVPYIVEFPGSYERGWVNYRARRDGQHVVFVDGASEVHVDLLDEGGEWSSTPVMQVQLTEGCVAYKQAHAVELESGRDYRLVFRRSPSDIAGAPPIHLFVEHLGSFGHDLLSERCQ